MSEELKKQVPVYGTNKEKRDVAKAVKHLNAIREKGTKKISLSSFVWDDAVVKARKILDEIEKGI